MNEYSFDELNIGMRISFAKVITKEMEDAFRDICGDDNPLHRDDAFAKDVSKGKFQAHVVFGMLTASLYSTVAGMYLPGKYSLIHSIEDIAFMKPVFTGDELRVEAEVIDKVEGLKLVRAKVLVKNQNDCLVSKGKLKILVMK